MQRHVSYLCNKSDYVPQKSGNYLRFATIQMGMLQKVLKGLLLSVDTREGNRRPFVSCFRWKSPRLLFVKGYKNGSCAAAAVLLLVPHNIMYVNNYQVSWPNGPFIPSHQFLCPEYSIQLLVMGQRFRIRWPKYATPTVPSQITKPLSHQSRVVPVSKTHWRIIIAIQISFNGMSKHFKTIV